jgi:hypothetical protein
MKLEKEENLKYQLEIIKFNKIYSSYSDIINFNLPEDQRSEEGKALIILIQISIYKFLYTEVILKMLELRQLY